MMIYCFGCSEYHGYCDTDGFFITCPECNSPLVALLGDVTVEKIQRIMEKLEAVWYDNDDLSLGEIFEEIFGLPFSDIPDSEVEKALDDFMIGEWG